MTRWDAESHNFGAICFILPVLSLIEHVLRPLLVEGAAHAAVGGEHAEYAGAVQPLALPRAPFKETYFVQQILDVR